MGVVLVTHDMGVIAETCQRVIVMYCGEIIETGGVKEIFANPKHPYTRGLLASIPVVREHKVEKLATIEGMVPDLLNLPPGCRFQNRCEYVSDKCRVDSPSLGDGNHRVACFAAEEGRL